MERIVNASITHLIFSFNGLPLKGVGFWIIDDNRTIRVSVAYEKSLPNHDARTVTSFLDSFRLLDAPEKNQASSIQDLDAVFDEEDYADIFRLAEQGHAKAQYLLGLMYASGEGVLENDKEAVKWYRKAAEQGDAKAQYYLGVSYASGRGVLKNYTEAYAWFLISDYMGPLQFKRKR